MSSSDSIDTAADQLDITKKILRALTLVRPQLALTCAEMLNTVRRRDAGIRETLLSYMRQDRSPVQIQIIDEGLSKIADQDYRENTIIKLLETGNRS